jgi:pimeloyl-ACP methyl ester carboxylesterase
VRGLGRTRSTRIALRVLLYGGALFVGVPLAFSVVMTRTFRPATTSRPPRGFEERAFLSDGLRLRAWLAEGDRQKPAALVIHGLGDSLESYLGHAGLFRERGQTVLLIDLRGHGASEGAYTTLGGLESHDVRAGMQYLRDHDLAQGGLVLMGHSMGAVAVLLAAAGQKDLRAVVVEAPYDTYRNTVAHHARLLYGLPSFVPLIPLAIRAAEWRAGFAADEVDAVAAARRIEAPLLAIVDGSDRRMTLEIVKRVFDAHPGPKRLWVAAGADHVGAFDHPDYRKVVLGFLDESSAARRPPGSGPFYLPVVP